MSAAAALLAWIVVTPPGWPVVQALSRASASAPRTSPMMMVGPKAHRGAHQAGHAGALSGMKLDEVARAAADLEGVLDNHVTLVRIGARDHLVDQRARQRRLAGAGPAGNQDVPAFVDCCAHHQRAGGREDSVA